MVDICYEESVKGDKYPVVLLWCRVFRKVFIKSLTKFMKMIDDWIVSQCFD